MNRATESNALEKTELIVIIRSLSISSEPKDICDILCVQGITINSLHRKVKRGDDKIFEVIRYIDLVVRVEKQY